VGDTIWYDINRNGVIDSGEPGLADITVTLLNGDGVVVATTVTNSSGVYLFAQLPPGTYTIVVDTSTLPSFWTQSFDPDGVLDARTTVTLRSGEVNLDQDFGFAEPAVLPPPPITTTTSTTTPITTPIAPPVTSPPGITPDTGGNFGSTLGIALLILVAGVGLVATARRRRTAG